jgi:hypothetical protein
MQSGLIPMCFVGETQPGDTIFYKLNNQKHAETQNKIWFKKICHVCMSVVKPVTPAGMGMVLARV